MTTVIVNDASCLIDLHKVRLLPVMLRLPYRFVVPLPIRCSEAMDLTDRDWRRLDDLGLVTFDPPPERIADVLRLRRLHPKLSANDCFCDTRARRPVDRGRASTMRRVRRRAVDLGARTLA